MIDGFKTVINNFKVINYYFKIIKNSNILEL